MKIYLETERMILREFTKDDVDNLFDLDSDPDVTRYINGGKTTPRKYIKGKVIPRILGYYKDYNDQGIWAALDKKDGAFMGWFHLRPNHQDKTETELGYRLKKHYWGSGYATEGAIALVSKGFNELHVDVIVAIADPDNHASHRVMAKAGLKYEKQYRENDGFMVVKYRLDRADFSQK